MAGIGFELKKIYGRKTLAANIYGSIYATMTTIGPSVISAILMLVLKIILDQSGLTVLESRFFISSTTYIFVIGTLTAILFSTPVSRYIADCIFLEKEADILPSAFGVLVLSTSISGIIMLFLCVNMYQSQREISTLFLLNYYLLGVLVTDVYSMMTYSSALKHYTLLTFSFFLGMLLAIIVYIVCSVFLGITSVTAAYVALVCCYYLILFMLVFQCVKTFGLPKGQYFTFLTYFRRYPKLAIGSIAYTFGIYCPTIIYWFFSRISEQVSIFYTAPLYDLALFLAIIVNMPALVIFVVKVETNFYEKYTFYVTALNNGTYDLIQKERDIMLRTMRYQLYFIYEAQLIITVVSICLISVFFPYLNVSTHMLNMFVGTSLGLYAVFCMYFTIIVFYYFSDYKSAYITSFIFLIVTFLGAIVATLVDDFYSLPLLIGGLCGWVISFFLLNHRMKTLDSFLICKNI